MMVVILIMLMVQYVNNNNYNNNNSNNNNNDNNNLRHDNGARYIHWQLCGKCGLERASNWYDQKPKGVVESENFKILRDFTVQCDQKIEARRPDCLHKVALFSSGAL